MNITFPPMKCYYEYMLSIYFESLVILLSSTMPYKSSKDLVMMLIVRIHEII